ncbi:putative bifunctional diguanylate cyclase/phosphodiesterase [Thiomicrorhabdus lithotrophica]|uniref:EAL domain-containing protein n=1 Tax=Thiomicrorhabdus lithotrophica TaxID=2949997 RepID=A0ABY8C9X4_9GAMM|nr:EAL domain-containing protein [Thiomicrorhabdus lithotrophica]WEJ62759.1 EAL domain-containing protein [Thiomicrorhabdus lithotrophica]
MLTINRFLAFLFLFIVAGLYSSFAFYYLNEQETKAQIITDEFHRILGEASYQIATELEGIDSINNFKSRFNRQVAQNNLIDAMIITKEHEVLLSTNPSIKRVPHNAHVHSNMDEKKVTQLLAHEVHQITFQVYEQNNPIYLSIYLYPNHYELKGYFSQTTNTYILYTFFPTILIAALLYWVFRSRLIRPLESLRKFAYYHDIVPQALKIKELEAIRSSMVQTFQRLEEETKALYSSSRKDALSGLPNRYQLNERLTWLIAESSRADAEFAFLFVDIDNFKNINDSLGHDVGDELLINVSEIMQSEVRGYDIIARFGGDEFVMVINKYQSHLELNHIIDRVLVKLSKTQLVRQQPINVTASIGVAFYPKDGDTTQTLLKNADIAMYEAKKRGKNQVHYFTEQLNQKIISEIAMEQELKRALANHEFEMYYQPKTCVKTGKVMGVESLIRWIHPKKGIISPKEFIPIAEQTGLIIPLGNWILQQAMQDQLEWQKQYGITLPVSVNVSAIQFGHDKFFSELHDLIYRLNFEPRHLDIEVTESVLMGDTEKHLTLLKKIRGIGISISLDDFGTGYSSLAYLKTFPINTLKIDKSFLDDYRSNSGSVFIDTMVRMAENLNISVVAEGVESQEQLDYLSSIQCQCYQGYYCSKPIPKKEFIQLVHKLNV